MCEDWAMKIKPAYSLTLLATVLLSVHTCIFAASSSGQTLHAEIPSPHPIQSPIRKSLLPTNDVNGTAATGSDEYFHSFPTFPENITNVTGTALPTQEKCPDGMVMSDESKLNWLCGLDTAVIGGEVSPLAAFNAWAEQV
jgi:hypothetical protein